MKKQIIINNCSECPFSRKQAERIVKYGVQYWRHVCDLSMEIIFDEPRDGEDVLSDIKIPSFWKLDNY